MTLRWSALALLLAGCRFDARTLDDAGVVFDGTPSGDAAPICIDRLEPNNSIDNASLVTFDNGFFGADKLAICPGNDTDMFQVEVTMLDQSIEAFVMVREGDGSSIDLVIQNGSGMAIAIGDTLEADLHHVCAGNLVPGTYFIEISEATDASYELLVASPSQSGPCGGAAVMFTSWGE